MHHFARLRGRRSNNAMSTRYFGAAL
ncbi:Protein of unknown function [Pyronema omphalodes CBS 100304]|uniref:Uncharacterized protein n=1 Tax=Pyronema omphalodes (strain CBS 100304) TaxID=1076935 RepID=U4LAS1_PYROM|nr:Protein of unknown function [Pyronema omphalodes CBS 100304]